MNAIDIDGVTKEFFHLGGAKVRVLDRVTLRIQVGEVVGLLGPNGSGKSTLLKIMVGLLEPTAGECRLLGVRSQRREARCDVGFLPEAQEYCPHLTGFEVVRFYARLAGIGRRDVSERVETMLGQVGLGRVMHQRVSTYSKGMRQRIGWAQALVAEPKVLILDEPNSGIDPTGAVDFGSIIRRLKADGKTVLFSSHWPDQVEDLCDRVAVLNRGRVILDGSVDELTRRTDEMALVVDSLPDDRLSELRSWLQMHGVGFHGTMVPRRGLEHRFLEEVGAHDREDDPPS